MKYVAYGVVLPVLVCLGVLGDVLNLVVLTRPNMTGVAYIYMRGQYSQCCLLVNIVQDNYNFFRVYIYGNIFLFAL